MHDEKQKCGKWICKFKGCLQLFPEYEKEIDEDQKSISKKVLQVEYGNSVHMQSA